MDKIRVRWGNTFTDDGYVSLPVKLLDNQKELNISDAELLFILKICRHKDNWKLHDSQITNTRKVSAAKRLRSSLVRKKLLKTKALNDRLPDGTFTCWGIEYDFSPLSKKLEGGKNHQSMKNHPVDEKSTSNYNNKEAPLALSSKKATVESNQTRKGDSLSDVQRLFLERFSKSYLAWTGIVYTPRPFDYKWLKKTPENNLINFMKVDVAYAENNRSGDCLFDYFFKYPFDEWVEKSDKSLTILLKPDIFAKFVKKEFKNYDMMKKYWSKSQGKDYPYLL